MVQHKDQIQDRHCRAALAYSKIKNKKKEEGMVLHLKETCALYRGLILESTRFNGLTMYPGRKVIYFFCIRNII